MPKSRWTSQHQGCQKAVDTVRADLTKEIERLKAENERFREAGNSLASYVYATNNPGAIGVVERQAIQVFMDAEHDRAKAHRLEG
jgi:hypothetical protein